MKLKYADYITEKTTGETTETLIKYLQDKEIIGEETEDGWYVIDTVKLMGSKQPYGNGTDGKTDVYVLEKKTETGMREGKKIASTAPIKIAENEETDPSEIYEVIYHGKNSTDEVNLGVLEINKLQSNKRTIKFYLSSTSSLPGYSSGSTSGSVSGSVSGSNSGTPTSNSIELEVEEGTTWLQWANDTSKESGNEQIDIIREYIRSLGANKTINGDYENDTAKYSLELSYENGINTSDAIVENREYSYVYSVSYGYHLRIEEGYQGTYGPVSCMVYLLDRDDNVIPILGTYNFNVTPNPQHIYFNFKDDDGVYIERGYTGVGEFVEYTITLNVNGELVSGRVSLRSPG